ncbi:subtilisin-like protease SBT3 [Rhododendron vialii]|uniref:subtilisin-like protease SBT3 n=1 Tax=Rhododendron vialii TaxID=182163 RepID=UPI00265FD5DD|nr:subtilisin-like protease SBT3 [Rhododendron vialii]
MAPHFPLYVFLLSLKIPQFISTLAELDNYIVHMDLSAMPKAFSSHHTWYLATISSILDNTRAAATTNTTDSLSTSSSKLIYGYSNAMHGFSASLSPSEYEAIKQSPGYVSSYRDMPVKIDTTHSTEFLGLKSESGTLLAAQQGKGVIVGVVDTGIWPESKSFNDDGMTEVPSRWKGECETGTQFNSSMCNKKLIGARFFNKGLHAKFPNLTFSMNSTRDTDGHGTHTSSTAAGNYVEGVSYFGYASGTARGVAPRSHVAMYKAFYSSDFIAAIDQAMIDGVDILSISLGLDGLELYEDPIAIATFAAMEKGIFVSTSAGNEGPDIASLHNGTPWVLTVAAGTIDREFQGLITLGNNVSISGSSLFPGNSNPSQFPLVFMGFCNNSEELKNVGRKIIVCQDKDDSLSEQVYYAENSSVTAAIFVTNSTDLESYIQTTFPAIFLNLDKGEIVLDYIKNGDDPTAKMDFHQTVLGTKPAPKVASYSSRGPSPSCPFVLKPDLMGPGSLILAAWPPNIPTADLATGPLFSQFNILSGTSMSCPHAAGVAALLKAARPDWGPAAIRSAMMTTSYSNDNDFNLIKDLGNNNKVATPLAMGSGQVDPNKALDPGLIYDADVTDYINLLCGLNYTTNQIKAITRGNPYNCSNPTLDINYPSFIAFFNADVPETVQEFSRTVTNVGAGMTNYMAKVTPMEGFIVKVVPEKLVFRERSEKQSYKVSIQGPKTTKEGTLAFGYLSWVEVEGYHMVRSPIVALSLSS